MGKWGVGVHDLCNSSMTFKIRTHIDNSSCHYFASMCTRVGTWLLTTWRSGVTYLMSLEWDGHFTPETLEVSVFGV
jgi:hypothetical protein